MMFSGEIAFKCTLEFEDHVKRVAETCEVPRADLLRLACEIGLSVLANRPMLSKVNQIEAIFKSINQNKPELTLLNGKSCKDL